ncbi:MAG: WhiB family transcriptional regulator [Acidothermus cellulolyticus]|nr:WhiB family transcriptional regulator [Acidothermus cellulolyticus]
MVRGEGCGMSVTDVDVGCAQAVDARREIPCLQVNPDIFFAEDPEDIDVAKALCRRCPRRVACLDDALQRREPWGVWGGELFCGGRVVSQKRPRGRPRKEPVV